MMRKLIYLIFLILTLCVYGCSSTTSKFTDEEKAEAIKIYEKYNGDQGIFSKIVDTKFLPIADNYKTHLRNQKIYAYNVKQYEDAQKQLSAEKVLPKNEEFKKLLLQHLTDQKGYWEAKHIYQQKYIASVLNGKELSDEESERIYEPVHAATLKASNTRLELLKLYHHDIKQDMKVVYVNKYEFGVGMVGYTNDDVAIATHNVKSTSFKDIAPMGTFVEVGLTIKNNKMTDLKIDYDDFELVDANGVCYKVSGAQVEYDEREKSNKSIWKNENPSTIKSGKVEELTLIYDLNIKPEDRSLLVIKKYDYKMKYKPKDAKEPLIISLRSDDWWKQDKGNKK